jgi:malate synthase
MSNYVTRAGLQVDRLLAEFIEKEALDGLDVASDSLWSGFSEMVEGFMPGNRELLEIRDRMQQQIDDWHRENGPVAAAPDAYQVFLKEIEYLLPDPADFTIETENLDPEIASICGPQLVVPVSNARYALNAANARWGSLYDALYGTDVIATDGELAPGKGYNPKRGEAVFAKAADVLDEAVPLLGVKHREVTRYGVAVDGGTARPVIENADGPVKLAYPDSFVGYSQDGDVTRLVFAHHSLHLELVIDADNAIGKTHRAYLADVVVESALTTIQDCEDSVAAVDAEDKVGVYRNWLGLMTGELSETFEKGGKSVTRSLNADRTYTAPDGGTLTLKGRALLLVRNVGHLMTTDAVLDGEGNPIGEGLMDAMVTALCAMHDLKRKANSTTGSIYIVKPKMHGPTEVLFACNVFGAVEKALGLPLNTIKIGIMDEERRTSANLKACIHAARERVFFINTGFLDRTGDEIHTSMEAGPVLPKDKIKSEQWIGAYEDRNVLIGLSCGLSGRAQIGKGMWAKPDAMAEMMTAKIGHPNSGANCAWVPSPTAATLHALHYHQVDVFEAQKRRHNEATPPHSALFSMPALDPASLTPEQIQREVDNNAQGILGYVVRWIDQGVGCSKVPDINDIGLMEDRATCRISSQAIANWLWHGVVTQDQVVAAFTRMARIVDEQNASDPLYKPMTHDPEHSIAFQAALALALEGTEQPSGYTEPLLHAKRREYKAAMAG